MYDLIRDVIFMFSEILGIPARGTGRMFTANSVTYLLSCCFTYLIIILFSFSFKRKTLLMLFSFFPIIVAALEDGSIQPPFGFGGIENVTYDCIAGNKFPCARKEYRFIAEYIYRNMRSIGGRGEYKRYFCTPWFGWDIVRLLPTPLHLFSLQKYLISKLSMTSYLHQAIKHLYFVSLRCHDTKKKKTWFRIIPRY